VLVTKYRKRCLTAAMLDELKGILEEQLEMKDGSLLEFNGEAEHVHMLMERPRSTPCRWP
jgi:putative transposase